MQTQHLLVAAAMCAVLALLLACELHHAKHTVEYRPKTYTVVAAAFTFFMVEAAGTLLLVVSRLLGL